MSPQRPARKRHARVVPCVGAIIRDADGRLLVVRRAHEPGKGLWSIPGGRIDPGETPEQALVREVREETGLDVLVGRRVGSVQRQGVDAVYDIADHECDLIGGRLQPGTDADAARWVTADELDTLPLTPLLAETLRQWQVL